MIYYRFALTAIKSKPIIIPEKTFKCYVFIYIPNKLLNVLVQCNSLSAKENFNRKCLNKILITTSFTN